MDDSRTQRTLDALADLYLTGPDIRSAEPSPSQKPAPSKNQHTNNLSANQPQGQPQNQADDSHSPAHNGPAGSAPLRLAPKLRIRHAPAPVTINTAARTPSNTHTSHTTHAAHTSHNLADANTKTTGPARPWHEVRQERRAQQAGLPDTDAGDLHGALADHMNPPSPKAQVLKNQSPQNQSPQNQHPQPLAMYPPHEQARDDQPEPHGDDHDHDHDHHDQNDHASYAFPTGKQRSYEMAASGVMTDEADGPKWGQTGRPWSCQAVYLGNLPGFAGPWLAQYAQLLAVKRQRVAIVHVTGEVAEVEIVSPLGVPAVEPAYESESIVDLFERLAVDDQCPLTQWLVHLPTPLTPDSIELGHDFDSWTLLTGADDAAVANGAQWLGKMLNDDRRHMYRQVGVSVMGSDPSRAQEVARRMTEVANDLLQQPVSQQPGRRQMAPVNIQQVGVFGPAMELWAEMAAYLTSFDTTTAAMHASSRAQTPAHKAETILEAQAAALHETAAQAASVTAETTREASPASPARPVLRDTFSIPDNRRVSPVRQSPAQLKAMQDQAVAQAAEHSADQSQDKSQATNPAPVVEPVRIEVDLPHSPAAASGKVHTQTAAQPATQTAQAVDAQNVDASSAFSESLDYIRWITPGAIALEARCPYKPLVQLALDELGRVHVMAGPDENASDVNSPRALAMDLLEVRQWVVDHLSVLRLTQRQCRFEMDAVPVVHLFATDGIAATTMARSLGESIKLHLLQKAQFGDQSTWVASPLN